MPSGVNIDLFPDCTMHYSAVPLEAPISFAFRISAWSRRNFESAKFPKGKREEEGEQEEKEEGGGERKRETGDDTE